VREIDLSVVTHLKPYSIAALCAIGSNRQDTPIRLIKPTNNTCAEHLARMQVYSHIHCEEPAISPQRPTNVPVRRLDHGPGKFSSEAMDVWSEQLGGVQPGVNQQLADHLDEVILNALHHAESPIGCVVAGQAFPNREKVEIAVLDLGQAIPNHLRKRNEYMAIHSDADAIIRATEEGVTGTVGTANSGVGLYELRTFCERGHGELALVSGAAIVVFRQGESPIIGEFRGGFQGTLVNMTFFTSEPLTPPHDQAIVSW